MAKRDWPRCRPRENSRKEGSGKVIRRWCPAERKRMKGGERREKDRDNDRPDQKEYEEKGAPCGSCPGGYYYEALRVLPGFSHVRAATFARRHRRRLPTFLQPHVPSNLVISRTQVTLQDIRMERSLSRYRLLRGSAWNLMTLILVMKGLKKNKKPECEEKFRNSL